ncbi:MAG: hypothetical protein JW700_02865 [Candidatus Aenigmarchaeota archaeon]|nr:hypothetical protein [Candidatus Aenigmarchaeota archaeon]
MAKGKTTKKNPLMGKNVRIIVNLGNLTIKYAGVLKQLEDWVMVDTKEGVKLINKGDCVLIEEFKP